MQSTADNRLIQHFLENSARVQPDKCAMIHGDVRLSYSALNQGANRLAHWLIEQGIMPGDRVALLLENCREYLVSYYGILKAGGIVVPLNPELKADCLHPILARITPRLVIASAKCERTIKSLDFSTLPFQSILIAEPKLNWMESSLSVIPIDEIIENGTDTNPVVSMDDTNISSIVFTSGSTGNPKGVMLSHRNITTNTRSIIQYLELSAADIQMVVLPFFYVMGKSLLNTHIAVGGTLVLNNKFAYPASVVQQMVDEQVTGFSGVPSTYAHLLHRSPFGAFRDRLTSLRYCTQAGGHMARSLKEALLAALPEQTKLYIMYGATEASARLTYVEPARLREKIDSIGVPVSGVTMKVIDKSGNELPSGETGELVATGPNIMAGYWNDPQSTESVLSPSGYRTGDLGYQDHDGYFHVTGRIDNQLKVGGHRVNPHEVEEALIATGLLIEAAVIGMGDPLAGHKLVAVAVPVDGSTSENDILGKCSKLLPRHKLPSEVRMVGILPKNSSGKVDRAGCLQLVARQVQNN